jgi:TonB family protein
VRRSITRSVILIETVLLLGAAPFLNIAAQQTLPPQVAEHLEYPRAEHLDSWSLEADDITLVIDRNNSYYLDSGDGDMRQIQKDSLASLLNQIYRDRQKDRVLYFLAASNTEYRVILNVLDIAHEAGVRVLAAVAKRDGDEDARIRAGMEVQVGKALGIDTVLEVEPPPGNRTFAQAIAWGKLYVWLQLLEDGSYEINREPVVFSQLGSRIHSIFEYRPAKVMFVHSSGNHRYQDVITAMDIARGAGVQVLAIWLSPIEVPQGIPPIDSAAFAGIADAVLDEPPRQLSCPAAEYPPTLQAERVEGQVMLRLVVDTTGYVDPATVEVTSSTHQAFEAPAMTMATGCSFTPGLVRGQPVRALVYLPVEFSLTAPEPPAPSDLQQACDGGDARACYGLCTMYYNGEGVANDYDRAASLCKKACDGGEAMSCLGLGIMYTDGVGVTQDDASAASFYQLACDGGAADGCYRLGVMYSYGIGVGKDTTRAASFRQRACDLGLAKACM